MPRVSLAPRAAVRPAAPHQVAMPAPIGLRRTADQVLHLLANRRHRQRRVPEGAVGGALTGVSDGNPGATRGFWIRRSFCCCESCAVRVSCGGRGASRSTLLCLPLCRSPGVGGGWDRIACAPPTLAAAVGSPPHAGPEPPRHGQPSPSATSTRRQKRRNGGGASPGSARPRQRTTAPRDGNPRATRGLWVGRSLCCWESCAVRVSWGGWLSALHCCASPSRRSPGVGGGWDHIAGAPPTSCASGIPTARGP